MFYQATFTVHLSGLLQVVHLVYNHAIYLASSEVDMVAAGDLFPYFRGNTDLVYALLSLPEC